MYFVLKELRNKIDAEKKITHICVAVVFYKSATWFTKSRQNLTR